ncbi:semaphorin 6 [Mytilus galloprovincialis]|uniref:Semaphorin-2A n=1 Tax=Mytilus galloprovincialis TaxID=29158 RepID=A0A8B6D4A7_MYTGA|nr:semaphorin 6 [Mytilus galloprovincialis]
MLLGGRNKVYNLSMNTLTEELQRIEWDPRQYDKEYCLMRRNSEEQCQNYIRLYGKKDNGDVYLCGTNAFKPRCRVYKKQPDDSFKMVTEEDGVGKSPFHPMQNSTAVYTDGMLFSGTVADASERDPLILKIHQGSMVRTVQHDSKVVNDPDFVSSFDIGDKVYFFFRETAVEHINCGKAVFSRVARVCKNDKGGNYLMKNLWTSFFKARLNCSIPGEYPFHFDLIQSTSDLGQGNPMSTTHSANRTDMVYAVFQTHPNSVRGSAVCAFRYSDIVKTFQGKFKGQSSPSHNWLAVPQQETPVPHPEQCSNDTHQLGDKALNFIKSHTLMDKAVPAAGGAPIVTMHGINALFTALAVDWQVHAADRRYYDIIFIGTDDGRVLKSINKGHGTKVESVIIEDIQVFENKAPVTSMKIFNKKGVKKLIVLSNSNVASIPLQRCAQMKTCRTCIGLQDPYCSWSNNECVASDRGFEGILTGHHENCGVEVPRKEEMTEKKESSISAADTAIGIVCAIVLSSIISFIAGYKVHSCRKGDQMTANPGEIYGTLTKNHTNKLLDNKEPRYVNHSDLERNNSVKQLNLLVNIQPKGSNLPNGGAPAKTVVNLTQPLPDRTYV